jgi:serine/threonine protein phosphatase PrpC
LPPPFLVHRCCLLSTAAQHTPPLPPRDLTSDALDSCHSPVICLSFTCHTFDSRASRFCPVHLPTTDGFLSIALMSAPVAASVVMPSPASGSAGDRDSLFAGGVRAVLVEALTSVPASNQSESGSESQQTMQTQLESDSQGPQTMPQLEIKSEQQKTQNQTLPTASSDNSDTFVSAPSSPEDKPVTAVPAKVIAAASLLQLQRPGSAVEPLTENSPRDQMDMPVPGAQKTRSWSPLVAERSLPQTPVTGSPLAQALHIDYKEVTTLSTMVKSSMESDEVLLDETSQVFEMTERKESPFLSTLTERTSEENLKTMLVECANKTSPDSATVAVTEKTAELASPITSEDLVDYSFAWSVATQKGYRYGNSFARNGASKLDIHPEMEDMHYPAQDQTPNNVHPLTGQTYQLFVLADGHGGHSCAKYAVERLPPAIIDIMNSRRWNMRSPEEQQELRETIQKLFLAVDGEYCGRKLEEFRQWIRPIIAMGGNPNDQQYRPSKPADDGCTIVVNILYDGFLVNCNVGDSRSVLYRSEQHANEWSTAFASIDHTPGHPAKAHQIHTNGGRYMINGVTMDISCYMEGFNLQTWNGQVVHESEVYDYLSRCRIGRQAGWRISEIDVQACTTLNLTGTMGDLFFKYNPSLITACPDVTFTPLAPLVGRRYMLIMATDGLWDHMREHLPSVQESLVAKYVRNTMHATNNGDDDAEFFTAATDDDGEELSAEEQRNNEEIQRTLQQLGVLAHGLCDREMTVSSSDLFAQGYMRYDDCTAFVVMVEGPAKDEEVEREQSHS